MSPPKDTTAQIMALLEERWPEAWCTLDHGNAYDLFVATVLSAQCTDVRVNQTTPALFAAFPDPQALAGAGIERLEELIRSTGFFRNKAKNLKAAGIMLRDEYGSRVPASLEDLIRLPGVARKTANVVLGCAFETPGVVVDTHVKRVSARLGWTGNTNPDKIERDLMKIWPQERWTKLGHQVILLGRSLCKARRPLCGECFLLDLCPHGSKEVGR
jgi:endonuclease III